MRHFDTKIVLLACTVLLTGLLVRADRAPVATQAPEAKTTRTMKTPVADKDYIVIDFSKGQYGLSKSDQDALRTLIRDAQNRGGIEKVEVAAWADEAMPAPGKTLSKAERQLAEKRADEIKHFLKQDLAVNHVDTYNMGERTNWLARAFHSAETELKSLFSKEASVPMTNEEFQVFKEQGDSSKAVILIKR